MTAPAVLEGYEDLPGYPLVAKGLADLEAGHETREALLVAVAAPRLRQDGIELEGHLPDRPKDRLFELLEREAGDDAHGQYNALLARVLSFLDAYEVLRRARPVDAAAG